MSNFSRWPVLFYQKKGEGEGAGRYRAVDRDRFAITSSTRSVAAKSIPASTSAKK